MDKLLVLKEVHKLIDEAEFGILATVDEDGCPKQRWMSPVFLPWFQNSLFCVTSEQFDKVLQLEKNAYVSWIFQSPGLQKIATISGKAEIVRDPMLVAETQEAIGPKLKIFWKYAEDPKKLVVLLTRIEEYHYFVPSQSINEFIKEEVSDNDT